MTADGKTGGVLASLLNLARRAGRGLPEVGQTPHDVISEQPPFPLAYGVVCFSRVHARPGFRRISR